MSAFFVKHPKETDLALFAGGESGPFARWRIERHLETCAECERTVADFFHLSEELSPLAEVPDVDWEAMTRNIEAGLALQAAEPGPRRGIPAWTWQLGAAAACGVLVVALVRMGPQADKEREMVAEAAIPHVPAPAAQSAAEPVLESRAAANQARDVLPERRSAGPAPQPLRAQTEATPEAEKKEMAPEPATLAFADRLDERLSTDAAAPAPPPLAKSSAAPAEADLLAGAGESRRSRLAAPSGGRVAGFGGSFRGEEAVFGVEPLPAAGDNVRVGADGWISVRAVSAEGALTITDVYEPQ